MVPVSVAVVVVVVVVASTVFAAASRHAVDRTAIDDDALLLLATLNRLEGRDDPHKRADLLAVLFDRTTDDKARVAAMLPESREQLAALMQVRESPPAMQAPQSLDAMPVPVHFFLLPEQSERVEAVVSRMGESREAALIGCVEEQRLAQVVVRRGFGRLQPLDEPSGAPLPRIC